MPSFSSGRADPSARRRPTHATTGTRIIGRSAALYQIDTSVTFRAAATYSNQGLIINALAMASTPTATHHERCLMPINANGRNDGLRRISADGQCHLRPAATIAITHID